VVAQRDDDFATDACACASSVIIKSKTSIEWSPLSIRSPTLTSSRFPPDHDHPTGDCPSALIIPALDRRLTSLSYPP